MKSYSYIGKFSNFKYVFLSFLRVNKYKLIFISFFVLVGLLTGVFTAIKYVDGYKSINFNDFLLEHFANGNIGSVNLFFQRMLSYSCFTLILLLCSLTGFLFPIGLFVIVYRTYLLGLNITLIVLLYGLGSVFSVVIIILPMQLVMIALGIIFFCLTRNRQKNKKKFGKKLYGINCFLLWLIFIALLTIVNILETVLLLLFSAQIILVI